MREIYGQTSGFTWHPLRFLLEKTSDLAAFRYLIEAAEVKIKPAEFIQQDQLISDLGLPFLQARSPFSYLIAEFSTISSLVFIIEEAPEEFEALLELMEIQDQKIFEMVKNHCDNLPIFWWGDNISSELWGHYFTRYASPYYQRFTKKFHQIGKKCGVHIDGTLRGCLQLLKKAGLDFAESVTPLPSGDLTIEEIRDLAGPDLILMGGLPGTIFSPVAMSTQDFQKFVIEAIEIFKKDGKAILASADQVPPDAPLERVKIVSELVEKYGKM